VNVCMIVFVAFECICIRLYSWLVIYMLRFFLLLGCGVWCFISRFLMGCFVFYMVCMLCEVFMNCVEFVGLVVACFSSQVFLGVRCWCVIVVLVPVLWVLIIG